MKISSSRQIKRVLQNDALIKALVDYIEITPEASIKALPGSAIFIAEYPYIVEFEAVWDIKIAGLGSDDLKYALEAIQAKLGGAVVDNTLKVKTFATEDLIALAEANARQVKQQIALQTALTKANSVKDGKAGIQGPKGEQGPVGPQGPQGVPGLPGKDGRDGQDLVATDAKLNDLQDVSVETAKRGNVLMYDGDTWVARFIEQRLGNNASLTQAELNLFKGMTEAGEPMGHLDRFASAISFDEATRTFTIAPVNDEYIVWVKAERFVIREPLSVQIPDVTGLYFVFFDTEGQLGYQTDYFYWDSEAPTAYIYWDANANLCPYLADERHGIVLDWQTHEYLHRTRGASFANGFTISNFTINGDGALDSSAQFDLNGGTFFDEDLQIDISHSETPDPELFEQDLQGPAKCGVFYKINSTWKLDAATNFAFKLGALRPYYNSVSGNTWGLTEVENNRYVNYYIVATHNLRAPIVSIMGQAPHVNITDAQEEDFGALNLSGFPSKEFRFLYKIILRTGNFANSVDCVIAGIQDLRTYSDQFVAALDIGSIRIDQLDVPITNVSFNNQRITDLGDPNLAQDATTKSYVDSLVEALSVRLNEFRDGKKIYVAKNGNDSNNGTSIGEPLLTLNAAAAQAEPGDTVFVGPGTYLESALPIRWKRDVSILGSGLRNTIVQPAAGLEYNDIFKVDSGFWCWGVSFAGHQADLLNGIQSWAVSFDELADNTSIGASGIGAFILKSPYIQNCTSITAEDDNGTAGSLSTGDTGGGIKVDGDACAPNSPIRSMVVDSYTQVNLGGPGCLVKNDGYAQLVSFFGTFCTYHVRTETGGQVNLSGGGTTDFGTYGLMADGYSPESLFIGESRAEYFGGARIEKNFTVNVSTSLFTCINHGLKVNDEVTFQVTNGSFPTGLSANQIYYIIADGLGSGQFKVSETLDGASIVLSGEATGTYQVIRQGSFEVDVLRLTTNRLGNESRPNAGQLMFPRLVFPRDATTGQPEAKTFTYSLIDSNTLSYFEVAAPTGPDHEYVESGTVSIGGVQYDVNNAIYNKTTGEVIITVATTLPASPTGEAIVSGLKFICLQSAYVIQSSIPIDANGVEVANDSPSRAGYRVIFYNSINGGLINTVTTGQELDFRSRSQISAPGHTFEYVGSGTNYSALPWNGGVAKPENAIVETNNGRVYSTNTNEKGDFAVGSQFSVDGTTGAVTINTSQFNVSGLNYIGPFSRNGGFSTVGVQLREVSNNSELIASTGGSDSNTVPTQFAVKEYTGQRYVTSIVKGFEEPITITGSATADGNGDWSYERVISLISNQANGVLRLDSTAHIDDVFLPISGVAEGTYNNSQTHVTPFDVDALGRITQVYSALKITPAWTDIASKPTTLSGFGIVDGATINSPSFTGIPTAPTAAPGTETTQLATTAFVVDTINSAALGITAKASSRVATTTNITLSGLQLIDDVLVEEGDRVLVKNQTNATENGIYIAAAGTWARSEDFNSDVTIVEGSFTFIETGTVNSGSGWLLETQAPIVVGTTELLFALFSGAGQLTAGDGLVKNINRIDIVTASSDRIAVNADSIDLALSGVTAGDYYKVSVDDYGRVTSGSVPTTLAGFGITDGALANHVHGNITNDGRIGTTQNLPIITGANGLLQVSSFGTTSNTFCQGNDPRLSDTRLTKQSITFDNTGSGAASGTTFNGGTARTISYNTIGSPSIDGTGAVGTWSISITGTAENANGLTTTNSYRVNSLGVGTNASGTAGEIRATNNITAYYSDDRLKTRLGKITDALAAIEKLSGFYYEANETAQALGYKPVKEVGVSAQEVQEVLPEAVAPAPIDEQYLTVRYERLVPLLIEAVKELAIRVDELEGRV